MGYRKEVFKLQKPVAYGNCEMLIYNEDRSVMTQGPLTEDFKEFFGKQYKVYAMGYIDKNGLLHIEKKVKKQDW